MDCLNFEIKNMEDVDFIKIVLLSLKQMEAYYQTKEKQKVTELLYNKETKDIEMLTLLMFSSKSWNDSKIEGLSSLLNGKIERFSVSQEDFFVIKYLTDLYWDYTEDGLTVYPDLSISKHFETMINFNQKKKTFKIVK